MELSTPQKPKMVTCWLLGENIRWLRPTKIFNLKADSIIGGHSDIVKPEIAFVLLQAAQLGK